jgi:large subunit ribosomal protein L15
VEYKGINLDTLQMLVESKKMKSTIVFQDLIDNGLVGKKELVKILGRGELSVKLDITAHAFSKSAVAAIEAKGGSATIS